MITTPDTFSHTLMSGYSSALDTDDAVENSGGKVYEKKEGKVSIL